MKNRVFQAESSRRKPNNSPQKRKMILTNCAACAAPLAHNAPRCVRCHTRYCDATCQDCCKLILGNKSDAPGRAVTTEEAREKADELACPFLETSAKSALNVEEAFLTLASELLRRAPAEQPRRKRLSLSDSARRASAKGKKCCA